MSNNTTQAPNITGPVLPDDHGSASTGFIVWGAALVFFMTPGLALFYSGLSKHNNALSLMMLCMTTMAIVTVQFFLFGFSLAFSETGGYFIGDFKMGAINTLGLYSFPNTSPQIPAVAFMVFQMQFATITAALIFGSVPERTRFFPAMIFIFLWTTVVYDFVAYWSWADHGWIRNFACLGNDPWYPCYQGGYDFAGGGPVHIASGFSGLAYCLILGRRKHIHVEHHSLVNAMLGVGILWFGWFAFNGGSAGAANARAAVASTNTTLAAAMGALTWVALDAIWTRKMSALSFCSGAVAGLVGVTPASGFVAPWAAIVIGFFTALVCNAWCKAKNRLGFDDSFEAFSIHGCGGFLGNILTGIFAQKWVIALDGTPTGPDVFPNMSAHGGWMEWNWIQVGYQIGGSTAIAVWSFVVSYILLFVINKIPGLHLRQNETDEALGGDYAEMGEVAYMLVISEADSEPLADDPHTLGFRHDGKRVSTADGLNHLTGEVRNSARAQVNGSHRKSLDLERRLPLEPNEAEMSSFKEYKRDKSPVRGAVNFAVDSS